MAAYISKSHLNKTTVENNLLITLKISLIVSRAAVVHLNFRAGSTFPVRICTVSPGHWVNKADTQ